MNDNNVVVVVRLEHSSTVSLTVSTTIPLHQDPLGVDVIIIIIILYFDTLSRKETQFKGVSEYNPVKK